MSNKLSSEYFTDENQYDTQILSHSPGNFEAKTLLERSEDESIYLGRFSRFSKSLHRGFNIGPFGLVLEPTALYEIIESAKISPMPGVNSTFKGLVNHRGNVAPVYDIAQILADTPGDKKLWERSRILILGTGNDAVGIVIYDLPIQIKSEYRVHAEDIQEIPEIFRKHAKSAYLNNDKVWLNINYEDFFKELAETNGSNNQKSEP